MSHLNPNAPSFSVRNYNSPGHNSGNANQSYNSNNSNSSGGMMPNDGYGSGPMMYDNNGGYPPQGGGGGSGGRGYNSGHFGGGNQGGNFGPSGNSGYMNSGQHQGGYGPGPNMPPGRMNMQRGPMPPNQYANPNNNMMGGGPGGGPAMRQGGYRTGPGGYHGGMDMNAGYDQQPHPQHMPMQQQPQQPMRQGGPNNMGMNANMMGPGRMAPPHAYNSNNNSRGPMQPLTPPMGSQSGMGSGNSSAAPPPMPAAPVTPPAVSPAVAAPSYMAKNTPRVVMVVGYKQTGKTSVAKAIAKKEGFEYVSLKGPAAVADDEEEEAKEAAPKERLAALRAVLEKKPTPKGLVLDDAVMTNRFHAHYIVHYLTKAGLQLDAVVALVPELALLEKRGVSFTSINDKTAHPEAFEFASSLDQTNVIAIVDDLSLKDIVERATADLSALLKTNPQPLELEEVCFVPNCPLVTDPEQVEEILEAERKILNRDLPYNFTYSVPNFVVDYVQFVQAAARLQYYMVTPWIWGDMVSLLGYNNSVYVHLSSYNLLFHLTDPPTVMQELLKKLRSEADAAATPESPASPLLFSLEASMLHDVFYISDMVLLGKQQGGEMLLHDRVKLLHECFGKLPASGNMVLLEHYSVSDIKECLEAHKDVSRGAIFVNPDGIEYGHYDVRNFLYPSENKKTVRLRIWDGRMTDETWNFDGYTREYEEEVLASTRTTGTSVLPVVISDGDVEENVINDGNVIECVMERVAAKGKSRDKSAVLNFCRRCKWEVAPMTQFYMWAFADPPRWSTESFLDACSTIAGVRPTV